MAISLNGAHRQEKIYHRHDMDLFLNLTAKSDNYKTDMEIEKITTGDIIIS